MVEWKTDVIPREVAVDSLSSFPRRMNNKFVIPEIGNVPLLSLLFQLG